MIAMESQPYQSKQLLRDRDDLLDVYKRKLEMTLLHRMGGEK